MQQPEDYKIIHVEDKRVSKVALFKVIVDRKVTRSSSRTTFCDDDATVMIPELNNQLVFNQVELSVRSAAGGQNATSQIAVDRRGERTAQCKRYLRES